MHRVRTGAVCALDIAMNTKLIIIVALLGFAGSVAWAQGQGPANSSATSSAKPAAQSAQPQTADPRTANRRAAAPAPSSTTRVTPQMLQLPDLPRDSGSTLLCACLRTGRHA
jgi:hypothetical protein